LEVGVADSCGDIFCASAVASGSDGFGTVLGLLAARAVDPVARAREFAVFLRTVRAFLPHTGVVSVSS
jgi:hypothetical protein